MCLTHVRERGYPSVGTRAVRRRRAPGVLVMTIGDIEVPADRVDEFCRRWKITELSLFGSALGDDFGPQSDVDILVSFSREADWSLLDHVRMERELSHLLGRKVDLVSRRAIERSDNWIRREAILGSAKGIYAAG